VEQCKRRWKNKVIKKRRRSKEKRIGGNLVILIDFSISDISCSSPKNARMPSMPLMYSIVGYKAGKNRFKD
jgi:hypothetical protein